LCHACLDELAAEEEHPFTSSDHQAVQPASSPEAHAWEEWRHKHPLTPELQHEPVHLRPLPPSPPLTPVGRRFQPESSQERIPEARRLRFPKHPRRHHTSIPATHVPHPEVITGSGPTATIARAPRPFLESNTPDRPITQRHPEPSGHRHSLDPTVLPEERTTTPPLPEARTSERSKPEEKNSDRKKQLPELEETASGTRTTRKLHRYDGKLRRKHTEKQIEEIVDWYLQTRGLPHSVSERQRYSYRHHRSLPERRRLLEQQGITPVIPETGAHESHVLPLERAGCHRSRRASGGV
jgi:hypothetical protein